MVLPVRWSSDICQMSHQTSVTSHQTSVRQVPHNYTIRPPGIYYTTIQYGIIWYIIIMYLRCPPDIYTTHPPEIVQIKSRSTSSTPWTENDSYVKRFSRERLDGWTDGWTDGHYQVHYLPRFAIMSQIQSVGFLCRRAWCGILQYPYTLRKIAHHTVYHHLSQLSVDIQLNGLIKYKDDSGVQIKLNQVIL